MVDMKTDKETMLPEAGACVRWMQGGWTRHVRGAGFGLRVGGRGGRKGKKWVAAGNGRGLENERKEQGSMDGAGTAFGGKAGRVEVELKVGEGARERRVKPARRHESGAERAPGTVAVGEQLSLRVKSPIDGWLKLYYFGMRDGRAVALWPRGGEEGRLEAGKEYGIPGELHPQPLVETGPTTAETGRKERLLAVVTARRVDLPAAAVDSAGAAFAARGGFAAADEAVGSLLDLPEDEWDYGLFEMEVVHG